MFLRVCGMEGGTLVTRETSDEDYRNIIEVSPSRRHADAHSDLYTMKHVWMRVMPNAVNDTLRRRKEDVFLAYD